MADLDIKNSSQMVSITGADSSGAETNIVSATSAGELLTSSKVKGSTGNEVTSSTVASKEGLDVNIVNTTPLPVIIGAVDKTTFTYGTTSEQTVGAVYQDTAPTLTAGTQGALRSTSKRALHINLRDDSGTELGTSTNPVKSGMMGIDSTTGLPIDLSVDSSGNLIVTSLTGFGADFAFGDITTAALTRTLVKRTAYTEQTTNAQRSIASASANDTAAGTGARTVKIEYLDQTGAGPFTETVTLNGTAYVNTVATNICFIEQITVLTAGSGGVNAGILTLKAATAGGGATIGTINAGDNQTFWAHHYVPIGKTCNITGISCGHNGTTVGSGALFTLNAKFVTVANGVEFQVSDFVRLYGQTSTFARNYTSPIKVIGPARIQMYVTPETSSSIIYRSAFDFFEP